MQTIQRAERIDHIMIEIKHGFYSSAKKLIQRNCKTVAERQAKRLGQVIGKLCEQGEFDKAVRLLNLFYNP